MRWAMCLLMGVVGAASAGCASHHEGRRVWVVERPVYVASAREARSAQAASALMFDAQPARYDAQAFAHRSDWPSTPSYYSTGQVIYFNEYFVDYQGSNQFGSPFGLGTYRRAESFRSGVGFR